MPEWISVKERLPQPFVSVLVFVPGEKPHSTIRTDWVIKDGLWFSNRCLREPGEVTHWMPMPLPPAEYLEHILKGGAKNG